MATFTFIKIKKKFQKANFLSITCAVPESVQVFPLNKLKLEPSFYCFLTYTSSYENCLLPQISPELIEAGSRVYFKKERKKSNNNL